MKHSCHYQIDNTYTSTHGHSVSGAISICDRRGVRGNIIAFDDTLIISPCDYYLNFNIKKHDINDKHLVYRMSDFNTTGIVPDHNRQSNYNYKSSSNTFKYMVF